MINRTQVWAAILSAIALFAGPSPAADDPAVLKDLTAVIALQGQPCGQVVSAAKQGDNDYVAACQDGSRYHVFVNAQGRVVVQKQ
ncbi:MAG: hypothetical protein DME07_15840 [Candidatus Rokuibacteriota bacterium]|nr:MAG: hypothetical protein DME07_15840 [Candidatus Rokubacteria bacterium]PYN52896.1 MAG: hypothetical protein DMD94_20675 [Candidatus Rokubacteria bacterium]